jgi:hypothetical protein
MGVLSRGTGTTLCQITRGCGRAHNGSGDPRFATRLKPTSLARALVLNGTAQILRDHATD